MLILGLLGMYFDAAVVFVTKSSLFFRLAMAILCATPWVWIKLNVFINSLTCWVKEWVQKWSLPKHHPQKRHQISHNLVCIISGFLIFLSIIQVTEKSSLRYICTFFFIPFIFHIWATLLTSDSLDLKQEEKKNCEKNWLWFRTC